MKTDKKPQHPKDVTKDRKGNPEAKQDKKKNELDFEIKKPQAICENPTILEKINKRLSTMGKPQKKSDKPTQKAIRQYFLKKRK